MKITRVNIPADVVPEDGLKAIKMDKLGKLVLIAGKNGSGKTRILNKIFNQFSTKPGKNRLFESLVDFESNKSIVKSHHEQLQRLKRGLKELKEEANQHNLMRSIKHSEDAIERAIGKMKSCAWEQRWNFIETDIQIENYSFARFVPKDLIIHDCTHFSKAQMKESASFIDSVGIEGLPRGTFAKIQIVQDNWFEATHQFSTIEEEEKNKAIDGYSKLCEIIRVFLNTEVDRTRNGEATLFGFPLGQSNLSDGQRVLLQFCMALYSQETALKDLILVLDEPENHLHPSIIIETIERILAAVTDGQVWIATHSISLLAHFDPSNLWYVEQGEISYAGKIPEKVLASLLGGEEEIAKLQDFISLPAQFATNRYAFESLLEPGAVMTDANDPQSLQIKNELLALSANGKLRVLDYGIGKGRLISNIFDLDEPDQAGIISSLDYVGFDKFNSDKQDCEFSIAKVYGDCSNRYFNDFNKLFSIYNKNSFDIVIMCNVLHEIDPNDWLSLFSREGSIMSCLKENGILLLVEDNQISIGEKAYQKGFLVLDTPQLKDLFKATEDDKDFLFSDKNNDGRLKAHQIPKRLLMNIDAGSRLKAIKSVSTNAKEQIIKIREAEKNYKNGKLHGFWTQQFANAQLNLAELGG